MVLAARTGAELPPQAREAIAEALRQRHGLGLRPWSGSRPGDEWHTPTVSLLEQALNRRLRGSTHLRRETIDGEVWYWIDLPVGWSGLAVGLPRDRCDRRPLEGRAECDDRFAMTSCAWCILNPC